MTLLCRIALLSISMLFIDCFESGSDSYLPEEEAIVIRKILQENGYNVGEQEHVDKYIEITSSDEYVDLHDLYWLRLPSEEKHLLVLTDDINQLNHKMFIGIKTHSSSGNNVSNNYFVDSILITTDSIINVGRLDVIGNKIGVIPKEIDALRAASFDFADNQIERVPYELMGCLDTSYYQTMVVRFENNRIDTLLLSDTLKSWLAKYAYGGENWWKSQEPYRYTAGQ